MAQGDDLMDRFRRAAVNTSSGGVSVAIGNEEEEEADDSVVQFYREYSASRSAVEDMRQKTSELERLYSERTRCSDPAKVAQEFPKRISEAQGEISALAKDVKSKLERLKDLSGETMKHQGERPAEARMQLNQYRLVQQEYKEALQAFNRVDLAGQESVQSTDRRRAVGGLG
eukprot:Hpha_TRINITY_DN20792_c0_g1::TRINITY_DN20792_c0_g1_i1::g.33413::m.33413